jgi:transketolase
MKEKKEHKKLEQANIGELEKIANNIRIDVIKMLEHAKSGHSAGTLGLADVFTALYFSVLNHDPKNPNWEDRDRLVISNGHICPVQYVAMAHAGYFPREEIFTLRQLNTRLQGHPHYGSLPGVENSSGPLGQGLPQAIGVSLASRLDKKRYYVYCSMGDGELDEGQIWEGAMFAGKNDLGNLIGFVDRNNIQIDGFTEDIMPLEPLVDKFKAFGWHTQEVDGHNIEAIIDAFNEAKVIYNSPSVIIAHTIPGKGVDFMEWDPAWHGKPPKPDEAKKALAELRTLKGKIKSEHE